MSSRDFARSIDKFAARVRRAAEETEVPFLEVFDTSFMSEHTSFSTMQEMIAAAGINDDTVTGFEIFGKPEWERIVRERTKFSNWKDMQQTAAALNFAKRARG